MKIWWDDSLDWSVAMEGCMLIKIGNKGRRGGGVAFYVREQLEYMNLCLVLRKELTENLWVSIKERTGKSDIIVGVFYRPPGYEEQVMRPSATG